jgi:hypothetical protein
MHRGILSLFVMPLAGFAQIDQQRAAEAFNHAKTLCERECGKLWKISLCGPIVIADPATKTIATNQPAPEAPRPAALGFTNSAMGLGRHSLDHYFLAVSGGLARPARPAHDPRNCSTGFSRNRVC